MRETDGFPAKLSPIIGDLFGSHILNGTQYKPNAVGIQVAEPTSIPSDIVDPACHRRRNLVTVWVAIEKYLFVISRVDDGLTCVIKAPHVLVFNKKDGVKLLLFGIVAVTTRSRFRSVLQPRAVAGGPICIYDGGYFEMGPYCCTQLHHLSRECGRILHYSADCGKNRLLSTNQLTAEDRGQNQETGKHGAFNSIGFHRPTSRHRINHSQGYLN